MASKFLYTKSKYVRGGPSFSAMRYSDSISTHLIRKTISTLASALSSQQVNTRGVRHLLKRRIYNATRAFEPSSYTSHITDVKHTRTRIFLILRLYSVQASWVPSFETHQVLDKSLRWHTFTPIASCLTIRYPARLTYLYDLSQRLHHLLRKYWCLVLLVVRRRYVPTLGVAGSNYIRIGTRYPLRI